MTKHIITLEDLKDWFGDALLAHQIGCEEKKLQIFVEPFTKKISFAVEYITAKNKQVTHFEEFIQAVDYYNSIG